MRYAAFLRAINVGVHNRIKMADLRALCETAGFDRVTTYLQSGNLVFESTGPPEETARRLETALVDRGLRNAAAIVRTADDLADLAACTAFEPFSPDAYTRFVTLFRTEVPPGAADLAAGSESAVLLRDRELFSVLPVDRPPGFDLNGSLEKRLKVQATTRYWHIVQEMNRLVQE